MDFCMVFWCQTGNLLINDVSDSLLCVEREIGDLRISIVLTQEILYLFPSQEFGKSKIEKCRQPFLSCLVL